MASSRAKRGGGTEMTINASYQYPAGGGGSAWFGPGLPMTPSAPAAVKGRAWDFPQGYNIHNTTRQYQPITFATLRGFADAYDLLRLIIETRKDAMERLRWVIQLRDNKEKLTTQKKNKIKELTKFFLKPDKEHHWNAWLRMILEDLFVIDAVSIHRRRTRGGKLHALDQIDGATVRRVLDDWGRTPEGKNDTAYQQILKGMPAVNYRTSDLLYRPRNLRVHKGYGYSPVEQLMMTINIGIRRQVFQLNYFTEGNMPESLIGVPEGWTPDQIRSFQEWFDSMLAGNLGERSKAKFVPSAVGKTYIETKNTELFGQAEEWLARVACFAFSISPQPFLQMMNRATADSAQQEAAATGLAPIQNWVKAMIDDVLAEDMDAADYEFVWRGDDELDPVKRQAMTEADVKSGLKTLNEGRVANGDEPYDDPRFDQPMFMTSNGLAPLLSSDLQGGNTPKQPAGQPADGQGDDQAKKTVKSLNDLVREGDVKKLAQYLEGLSNTDEGASQ